MEAFVERMVKEHDELHDRLNKLYAFLQTDKFQALASEEQGDLLTQYHAMVIYRISLRNRLRRQGYDEFDKQEA